MGNAVLTAHDLWKTYDGHTSVLRSVDFSVGTAEATLIWGPNGSGKTTLLSILGGLDAPTRGRVDVGGREITGLKERALAQVRLLEIGFVFQTHRLIEDISVEENLALPLRLAKRPAEGRVRELLETFGLQGLAGRKPGTISVGESQRVAVARALANGPKIILADEPTASLDTKGTAAVLDAFRLARASFGAAIVIATHDPDVRGVATAHYVLDGGLLRKS